MSIMVDKLAEKSLGMQIVLNLYFQYNNPRRNGLLMEIQLRTFTISDYKLDLHTALTRHGGLIIYYFRTLIFQ